MDGQVSHGHGGYLCQGWPGEFVHAEHSQEGGEGHVGSLHAGG